LEKRRGPPIRKHDELEVGVEKALRERRREALLIKRVPLLAARWRQIFFKSVAIPLFIFFAFPLSAQEMQQDYRQFEIDTGASVYASNCVECHTDGTGVPGVNFKTGQLRHVLTDEEMLAVVRNGVPGTAMPPHNIPGADLVAVVAYVRSMSQDKTNLVKLGDPAKGKDLFENEGQCLNCHRVHGKGSHAALNLSDAGTLHPPSFLEHALLDPNATAALMPESRLVRAVTNKGTIITGRRMNEDTYTIQLMGEDGNLVPLEKDDLRSLTILKDSPMPSLKGKFTDEQIGDLVAYLASLKSATQLAAPTKFGTRDGIGNGFPATPAGRGQGTTSAPVAPAGAGVGPPASGGTGPAGSKGPGGNP
jgi:putative heme-binding domain-containing protein